MRKTLLIRPVFALLYIPIRWPRHLVEEER